MAKGNEMCSALHHILSLTRFRSRHPSISWKVKNNKKKEYEGWDQQNEAKSAFELKSRRKVSEI